LIDVGGICCKKAVGEQNGLISIGSSMVVNPDGEVIAEAKRWKKDLLEFNL
jgi:predicted amidohydrolase